MTAVSLLREQAHGPCVPFASGVFQPSCVECDDPATVDRFLRFACDVQLACCVQVPDEPLASDGSGGHEGERLLERLLRLPRFPSVHYREVGETNMPSVACVNSCIRFFFMSSLLRGKIARGGGATSPCIHSSSSVWTPPKVIYRI